MRRLTLLLLAFVMASVNAEPEARCDSTQTEGASRRSCIDEIVANITTAAACKDLCCADSAAHPIPYPGAHPTGCVAWYHSEYHQCFICKGVDRHGSPQDPPAANHSDTKSCTPREPPKNKKDPEAPRGANSTCTTGVITPAPAPIPPKPPAVIPHYIGTEASAQV
jgi:hypothetical protein